MRCLYRIRLEMRRDLRVLGVDSGTKTTAGAYATILSDKVMATDAKKNLGTPLHHMLET